MSAHDQDRSHTRHQTGQHAAQVGQRPILAIASQRTSRALTKEKSLIQNRLDRELAADDWPANVLRAAVDRFWESLHGVATKSNCVSWPKRSMSPGAMSKVTAGDGLRPNTAW